MDYRGGRLWNMQEAGLTCNDGDKMKKAMISFSVFKEIFDAIPSDMEPEITFCFFNRRDEYMIIKYNDRVTFQRCGTGSEQSGEISFGSLEELYNAQTIDNICLKNEWNGISGIIFDSMFDVNDSDALMRFYGIRWGEWK